MALASHRTIVDTTREVLWDILMDKTKNPQKYIESITDVTILEELDEYTIVREMTLGNGKKLKEIITADPKSLTIIFKSLEDPTATSLVTNTIYEEDGLIYLEYTLSSVPKPGHQDEAADVASLIKGAVEHTKKIAEANTEHT